jgi:hypothetical protein
MNGLPECGAAQRQRTNRPKPLRTASARARRSVPCGRTWRSRWRGAGPAGRRSAAGGRAGANEGCGQMDGARLFSGPAAPTMDRAAGLRRRPRPTPTDGCTAQTRGCILTGASGDHRSICLPRARTGVVACHAALRSFGHFCSVSPPPGAAARCSPPRRRRPTAAAVRGASSEGPGGRPAASYGRSRPGASWSRAMPSRRGIAVRQRLVAHAQPRADGRATAPERPTVSCTRGAGRAAGSAGHRCRRSPVRMHLPRAPARL